MDKSQTTLDLLIVGAGPAGLYAGFYASLRNLSYQIIDVSNIAGGQPATSYSHKDVYDFPGNIRIKGADIASALHKQWQHNDAAAMITFNVSIKHAEKVNDQWKVTLSNGTELLTKKIILATGSGPFLPIKVDVEYDATAKIAYKVESLHSYDGKRVVILGGGDSAVDWANMLAHHGIETTLMHRRKDFRAKHANVSELQKNNVHVIKEATITKITASEIFYSVNSEQKKLHYDEIIVQYGMQVTEVLPNGINVQQDNGKFIVDATMATSVAGIYAIGTCCIYAGKTSVLATAMGEAVTAITAIAVALNPNVAPTLYTSSGMGKIAKD